MLVYVSFMLQLLMHWIKPSTYHTSLRGV